MVQPEQPGNKEDTAKDYHEHAVFGLAIILISGFLFFYGVAFFNVSENSSTGEKDYSGLDRVASSLGGIVAAVVGYYFGQRPAAAAAKQAAEARSETRSLKKKAAETFAETDEAKAQIGEMRKELESIKRLLGE